MIRFIKHTIITRAIAKGILEGIEEYLVDENPEAFQHYVDRRLRAMNSRRDTFQRRVADLQANAADKRGGK